MKSNSLPTRSTPGDANFYQFFGSDSSGQLISPAGTVGTFKANINYVWSSNLLDQVSPTTTNPAAPKLV